MKILKRSNYVISSEGLVENTLYEIRVSKKGEEVSIEFFNKKDGSLNKKEILEEKEDLRTFNFISEDFVFNKLKDNIIKLKRPRFKGTVISKRLIIL